MIKNLDNKTVTRRRRPVKALQFGEGNFLRAFADWMIDVANEKGVTDCGIAIVKPRIGNSPVIDTLKKQDCLYNVVLEGIENGIPAKRHRLVTSVESAFTLTGGSLYDDIILSEELRFVISNTTEAGIKYEKDDITSSLPSSFPGKITALLWKRFNHFKGDPSKGLFFIPCELIEDNGSRLKEIVMTHAKEAGLGADFISWIEDSCAFVDTLVDRIVSGAPDNPEEEKKLTGFNDDAIVKGEIYSLWVVGGAKAKELEKELPLHKAGLNVKFMDSIKEFRDRKVRVLNGSHTGMVAMSLLAGCKTVLDAFGNDDINTFVNRMVQREVLPVIEGDPEELNVFANGILERFLNPYIRHMLESIALNSISKWEVRNYVTVKDYYDRFGKLAEYELFTLASLLTLYAPDSGFTPSDTASAIDFIHSAWNGNYLRSTVKKILGDGKVFTRNFDAEIPGMSGKVAEYVEEIKNRGIEKALKNFLKEHE